MMMLTTQFMFMILFVVCDGAQQLIFGGAGGQTVDTRSSFGLPLKI